MGNFISTWMERMKKGDIFPLFIIGAIVGLFIWMVFSGFPWGIIATIVALGVGFGLVELIWKLVFKKTVSQEWWKWAYKTAVDLGAKYLFCPSCGAGFCFPNKSKANTFCILLVVVFIIVSFGHLVWR